MKNITFIIIVFLFVSCGNSQTNKKTFVEKGNLTEVGVNPELINNLVSDIKAKKINNVHGLLIIKDDKLITEEYLC